MLLPWVSWCLQCWESAGHGSHQSMAHSSHWGRNHPVAITLPLTTSGKDTACLVTLLVGSAWGKDGGCAALKDVAHPP